MEYKSKSIWQEENKNIKYPTLDQNINVDVVIIGGGITGISCAYHLIHSGLNVCLLERNEIASGVTAKTTGKLTYLQENLYSKINKYHNYNTAKLYLESQKDAIKLVKEICQKEKINCNLEQSKSYILPNEKDNAIKKEKDILEKLNCKLYETNDGAFFVKDTYVFHPLKYLYSLAQICSQNNISIFENTNITTIDKQDDKYKCCTDKNYVISKYVILALHYPYFVFPYLFPLKTSIEKSYIKAFKVNSNPQYNAITVSKPTISIRYHQDKENIYEIFLTNSHLSCIKHNEEKNFKSLLNYQGEYLWSNMDIMTNDYLPFIGSIDPNNTLFIGTGYNTWGMTNGTIAGKIISDLICKKENKYIQLFNPKRRINLAKVINFPLILMSNMYSIITSKFNKQKSWYPNNVKFEKRNGKNIAIYIDENKKEHIVYNLCPHMKCSLIFNIVEKTWDCPCHGSRFDIDGHVIEGPSNYNITFKE